MNEVFCMAASILWLPNAPFSIRTLSGQSQKDGPTSSYFLWVICASTLWNCILYTSPAELTKLASRLSRLPRTAVYTWNRLECIKTAYLKQRPRVACKPFLVRLSGCPFFETPFFIDWVPPVQYQPARMQQQGLPSPMSCLQCGK